MTSKEIQEIICKAEIRKSNLVAENFNYFFAGEQDVISVNKSGYVSEFEVKISRADFKADAKKKKWRYFEPLYPKYIPNYFTYVCPSGLITEADLKPYMGLIYIEQDMAIIVRRPKLIHKWKHNLLKLLTKMCTVNNWKHYYGAQPLTIQNQEIKKRNDERAQKELSESFMHIHNKTLKQ